jgi:hypothetical protein
MSKTHRKRVNLLILTFPGGGYPSWPRINIDTQKIILLQNEIGSFSCGKKIFSEKVIYSR